MNGRRSDMFRLRGSGRMAAIVTTSAVLLACAHASAQSATKSDNDPLAMKEDYQARERPIASQFFGYWLDGAKDGKLETAVVDLNGDGTAEIFIRLVHTSTCDPEMKACRTVALKHDGSEWKMVFDRPASGVAIGRPGKEGMRDILVNDYEKRIWNGRFYQVDASSLKATAPKFQSATGSEGLELSRGFGNAAEALVKTKRATVDVARTDLGNGRQGLVVRMAGEPACGIYLGCPVRVLVPDVTGRNVAVLETSSKVDAFGKPDIKVTSVIRAGWPSLVFTMPDSTPLMADWDGRRYILETRR